MKPQKKSLFQEKESSLVRHVIFYSWKENITLNYTVEINTFPAFNTSTSTADFKINVGSSCYCKYLKNWTKGLMTFGELIQTLDLPNLLVLSHMDEYNTWHAEVVAMWHHAPNSFAD